MCQYDAHAAINLCNELAGPAAGETTYRLCRLWRPRGMAEEAAYWQSMFCQSWHTSWEGQQNMVLSYGTLSDGLVKTVRQQYTRQ